MGSGGDGECSGNSYLISGLRCRTCRRAKLALPTVGIGRAGRMSLASGRPASSEAAATSIMATGRPPARLEPATMMKILYWKNSENCGTAYSYQACLRGAHMYTRRPGGSPSARIEAGARAPVTAPIPLDVGRCRRAWWRSGPSTPSSAWPRSMSTTLAPPNDPSGTKTGTVHGRARADGVAHPNHPAPAHLSVLRMAGVFLASVSRRRSVEKAVCCSRNSKVC